MKSFIASLIFIVIFVLSGNVSSEENKQAESHESSQDAKDNSLEKQDNEKVQKVKYVIDFSNYSGGTVRKWLESKGFYCEGAAKYHPEIELSIQKGMLFIKTKQPVRGFLVFKDIIIPEVSKVRIEWGIIKYPKDANFESGNRNQALGLYIPEFQTYFIHYKFLSNILSTHAIISSCFFDSVTVRDILKSFFESLI